ncbi:MAG: DUF1156 domain-containing protein, partial [Holophagaceae bacterium]|nr:DUF1156 domain-containing protein [Candidatus Geothrix odensensis]
MSTSPRKKLIEVSLPLDAINTAAAKEKSIRHGHPSTFHLWWSRKPLAACRAVLFASIIDDPSSQPERFPTKEAQDAERDRLHHLIERMVPWEATQDEVLMKEVRDEILTATGGNPPSVSDPFCGGGSIPLEAQRLGLEAFGSDLNPVPVLITKALVEIPPRFANHPPLTLTVKKVKLGSWRGAQGLGEDVRYYGEWLRNEAKAHIGYLYPNAKLPKELGGGEATVIAWLWARTVTCPNPACNCQIPLTSKWNLSTKKGKETHVHPLLDRTTSPVSISFQIRKGLSPEEGTVNRRGATCVACGSAIPFTHIRLEGKAGRMGSQMIAIAAEYKRGRIYLPPDENHIKIANSAVMDEKPTEELPKNPRDFKTSNYGLTSFGDLYTTRQLVALNTLGRLLTKVRER